jgi:hypothetical protein
LADLKDVPRVLGGPAQFLRDVPRSMPELVSASLRIGLRSVVAKTSAIHAKLCLQSTRAHPHMMGRCREDVAVIGVVILAPFGN